MSEDTAALRAVVRGRVQGVGFRFFAVDVARALGVKGYVRNLSDGRSVEVVAEGLRSNLDALLVELRKGPPAAYVERVQTTWMEPTGGYEGFGIR